MRCWLKWSWALLALWLASAANAVDYRFATPDGPAPVSLSVDVLSPEERAYIASLPELRVALQTVGAPPYEKVGADGVISGFQPEMLRYLSRTFGLRVRPIVYPTWPEVLRSVREGEADIVLTLAVTPERQKFLAYTLGTVQVPVAVMGKSGRPVVPVHKARIALEREYFSNELVQRRYPQAEIISVDTTVQALQAVHEGRADAYVGSLLEALDILSHTPVPGIEVQQILSAGAGYYHFGLRKGLAPLAQILNKGITSWRTTSGSAPPPSAQWAAAMASGAKLAPQLALSPEDAALLVRFPMWRVGAVRGLALLNDISALGDHSGIASDYVEQVARRLGVSVELVAFDSVAQMLDGARAGQVDVIPFLTYTEERTKDFVYSKPYVEMPYVLVGRTDGTLYWDLQSLRGRQLGMAPQHPLRPAIQRRHPEIRVVDTGSGFAAMDAVVRGEADAAVEVKLYANLYINGDGGGRLRALGDVDELPAGFHFATPARSGELIKLIDRALADMPGAEHERLYRRWVAVDLAPGFPWRRWAPTIAVAATSLLLLALASAWWVRRQAAEVRMRRRADEQLDDIGRTMPGVAFRHVVDEQGQLLASFFSSGAATFLGVVPHRRQTLLELIGPRLRPEHAAQAMAASRESMRSGERFHFTGAYRHPRGDEIWLRAEAVRTATREGRLAWTGYVVDISEQVELQNRIAGEAEERHVLLASASHELRAPTHTISLALQSVPDDGLPEALRRPLAIAREGAHTLSQLLDDVLDAARLNAGKLELRPRDFDLRAAVQQVAESFQEVMSEHRLAYSCHVADDVPRTMRADPLRLKQVLINLLSNAAKYTPAGSVRLEVDLEQPDDGLPPRLRCTVEDTGVGIPAEQQARLFQPFASVGNEAAEGAPSSGLGLSICRRLVDLMGGEISLSSQAGLGTRVQVRLPLDVPGRTARPLRASGVLLLCDDDPVSRMLMSESLARLGHEVAEVRSGEEALARWRSGGVRLMITDLTMPGMDGIELITEIRAEEADAPERTGIVVCSGNLAPSAGTPAADLACDAFLVKPVQLATLQDTLQRLLQPRT